MISWDNTLGTLQRSMRSLGPHEYLTLFELHDRIETGYWAQTIVALREAKASGDAERLKQLKDNLPAFVCSGQFKSNRRLGNLTNYTGIHYIDVDFHDTAEKQWTQEEVNGHLERLFRKVKEVPWIVEAHRSASGMGAHLFVWTGETELNEIEHKARYTEMRLAVEEYFDLPGLTDPACADPMRIMFVSYDPEAYLRPLCDWKAYGEGGCFAGDVSRGMLTSFAGDVSREAQRNILREAEGEAKYVEANGRSSLREAEGEANYASEAKPSTRSEAKHRTDVLRGDAWTAQKERVAAWKKKIRFSELKAKEKRVVENFLSSHQYRSPGRHNFWTRYLMKLRKNGIVRDRIEPYIEYMQLLLQEGFQHDDPLNRGEEIEKILDWVYMQPLSDTDIRHIQEKKLLSETIREFVGQMPVRHNLLKGCYEMEKEDGWKNITDEDVHDMKFMLEQQLQRKIAKDEFRECLHSSAVPQVNPLLEYLEGLPEWDGHDYIQDLANTVRVTPASDQGLFYKYFTKWLVAMVKGWIDEDVVNHEVLVLIGEQGIYKSTWLRKLLPPVLKEYVADWADKGDISKDDRLMTAQFGLINMDELDAMTDRQVNQVKSLITASVINERAAYRENSERRIHIASFCGSGNKPEFLTDTTGNRRWLPFMVEHVDEPEKIDYHYEQLYAQVSAYLVGQFQYWLDQDENKEINEHCRQFLKVSAEEELIRLYFEPIPANETRVDAKWLSASEVLLELQGHGLYSRMSPTAIGMLMSDMGYEQKRTNSCRKYHMLIRSIDKIESVKQG